MKSLLDRLQGLDLQEVPRKLLEEAVMGWRESRAKRLELERQAREVQSTETLLKSWVVEVFRAQEHEGCVIGGRITGLITNTVPAVADKEAFLNYIRETGELDLLQFQVMKSAVEARKEDGVEVPGIEFIDVYNLSDKNA